MRVELPQPQQGATPSQPPANGAGVAAQPTPPPRRRSRHERWVLGLTSLRVVLPTLAVCTALLGWTLLFREAQGRKALLVMARSTPPTRGTNVPITAEILAALKEQQIARSQALIRERREIPPILSQLEFRAQELGWHCERVLKPVVAAPFGLTNLTLHPVTLHLSVEENAVAPPFHRLTDWLRTISSLPQRSEITQLDLQADGRGLSSAVLTLHFYSAKNNAEASTK